MGSIPTWGDFFFILLKIRIEAERGRAWKAMVVTSNFGPYDVRTLCRHELELAFDCPSQFWWSYEALLKNSLLSEKFQSYEIFFLHVKIFFFFLIFFFNFCENLPMGSQTNDICHFRSFKKNYNMPSQLSVTCSLLIAGILVKSSQRPYWCWIEYYLIHYFVHSL